VKRLHREYFFFLSGIGHGQAVITRNILECLVATKLGDRKVVKGLLGMRWAGRVEELSRECAWVRSGRLEKGMGVSGILSCGIVRSVCLDWTARGRRGTAGWGLARMDGG